MLCQLKNRAKLNFPPNLITMGGEVTLSLFFVVVVDVVEPLPKSSRYILPPCTISYPLTYCGSLFSSWQPTLED